GSSGAAPGPAQAAGAGGRENLDQQNLAKLQIWEDLLVHLPTPPMDWVVELRLRMKGLAEAVDQANASERRALRLGTPCAGFEAPLFALRCLGLRHLDHVFSVDVAAHAATFGHNLRRAMVGGGRSFSQSVNDHRALLGPREGDLMSLDLRSLPAVDILVAGPPCPPWSKMGHREGCDDDRAAVFWSSVLVVVVCCFGSLLLLLLQLLLVLLLLLLLMLLLLLLSSLLLLLLSSPFLLLLVLSVLLLL
ncbi:unnamed protein product, partial [Polarella glacialis]